MARWICFASCSAFDFRLSPRRTPRVGASELSTFYVSTLWHLWTLGPLLLLLLCPVNQHSDDRHFLDLGLVS